MEMGCYSALPGGPVSGPLPDARFSHTPVLLAEVLSYLQPRAGQTVVDATLGGGGHAAQVLRALAPGGRLVGIDRDPAALRAADARLRPVAEAVGVRLDVVRANYSDLAATLDALNLSAVDGVLFDLGVSSPQFDDPSRGFTYRADTDLDMRMDPDQTLTAYHLINGLAEGELAGIIRRYGEERWAARIASFIVQRRARYGMIATTGELVDVIMAAVPAGARRHGPHPARRTFQALRIAVNSELEAVEAGLRAAAARLHPGGRLVAIAFHSLEDRIVKQVLRELSRGCTCPPDWPVCRCGRHPTLNVLASHPVQPGAEEAERNPRARSAKLRAAVRLADGATNLGGEAALSASQRPQAPPPGADCDERDEARGDRPGLEPTGCGAPAAVAVRGDVAGLAPGRPASGISARSAMPFQTKGRRAWQGLRGGGASAEI